MSTMCLQIWPHGAGRFPGWFRFLLLHEEDHLLRSYDLSVGWKDGTDKSRRKYCSGTGMASAVSHLQGGEKSGILQIPTGTIEEPFGGGGWENSVNFLATAFLVVPWCWQWKLLFLSNSCNPKNAVLAICSPLHFFFFLSFAWLPFLCSYELYRLALPNCKQRIFQVGDLG